MSSKRDLVEAHAFNRRRLVTAFISGAPGGREVEPVRPGRTLVGGLVLAVLMVAGAAVAGFLKPTLPDDWTEYGLVVGKETGSRYLAYEGELYPVINTTSARLLLDDFKLTFAPEDKIAAQDPGTTIGIPGAPDALPSPGDLVQGGWTSCLDQQAQVKTRLAERPGARPAGDAAVLVEAGGTTYVVTGDHRYPVPGGSRDATLRALGLDDQTARPAPGRWVDLFTLGSALEPFELDRTGEPAPAGLEVPSGATRIGTPLIVDGRPFLVAADGLVGLTDLEYAMYRSGGAGAGFREVTVDTGDIADVPTSQETPAPEDWPDAAVSSVSPAPGDPTGSVCALMETPEGDPARAVLALPTAGVSGSPVVPSPEDGSRSVEVQSGHGALVQATSGGVVDRGTVHLVDASGTRYALGGSVEETAARLGYSGVEPVDVPVAWTDLFAQGPELSAEAARLPAVSP